MSLRTFALLGTAVWMLGCRAPLVAQAAPPGTGASTSSLTAPPTVSASAVPQAPDPSLSSSPLPAYEVRLQPEKPCPGAEVTLDGANFRPGSIELFLSEGSTGNPPVPGKAIWLGRTVVSPDGRFSVTVTLPTSARDVASGAAFRPMRATRYTLILQSEDVLSTFDLTTCLQETTAVPYISRSNL